jgi:hypothetical protein
MTIQKISTAIATSGAFFVLAAGVAFANTDVTISGNGADSVNSAKVIQSNSSLVNQSNVTKVGNHINSSASTGGNTISKSTGGDATIDTGNATSTVSVLVSGGDNHLVGNSCGCPEGDTTIDILDNGADTTNKVTVKDTSSSIKNQYGKTKAYTTANSKAKTGKNKIKKTTDGASEVKTGDSESAVSVIVTGGTNHSE